MAAWLIWLIAAVGLALAESLSLDFVLIMCATGAGAGAVAAAAGAPVGVQFGLAVLVSAALVLFVRPVAKRHLTAGPEHQTGSAALVGRPAVVLTEVDAHGGRVRLNGQEWSARSYDSRTYPAGTSVRVMQISGATAVVLEEPFAQWMPE